MSIPTPGKTTQVTPVTPTMSEPDAPQEDHVPHVSDPPRLADLNTHFVANAGAGLTSAGVAAVGLDLTAATDGRTPAMVALVLPFVAIAVGVAMTYFGRPVTILAQSKEDAAAAVNA